jgi:hypothetical protein
MKELYGKCGCNCGQCPAFIRHSKTAEDRQRCSDGWHKVLGVRLRSELIHCNGCQSTEAREKGDILPDRGCYIRPCATFLGIKSCAQCYAYPCDDLQARMPGEDFRELVESRIKGPLSEEEYHSFVEPYEALKNLKKVRASLAPEDIVEKRDIPPIKARTVDFPKDLPYPKNEITAYRDLHKLLTEVSSARADTYARQLILKRRRKDTYALLWIMGLRGEISQDGSHLVLDSMKSGSNRESNWMVRKRDTTLFSNYEQSLRSLHGQGVRYEFKSSKKDWIFRLSFLKKAGGSDALKALKNYVGRLVGVYGEPEYVGASKYKGKAFTLFKKTDMRVLEK